MSLIYKNLIATEKSRLARLYDQKRADWITEPWLTRLELSQFQRRSRTITVLAKLVVGIFFFVPIVTTYSQPFVGQSVPDITEYNCQGVPERIYDVLAEGKPILVFRTDMICSNTTAWGTTIRQFANVHAATYRTWVCADFIEANTSSEQCTYMQQYEQQTGMNTNTVFRFIDETSQGAYDPNARKGIDQIFCFQGYIVIGLDSTIKFVGNSMTGAVNAALAAAQVTTAIDPHQAPETIKFYPNPMQDFLQWVAPQDARQIEVFDNLGKLVLLKDLEGESIINLTQLVKGFYKVRIHFTNGTSAATSIIKH